jgi:hypothetical protein
MLKLYAVKPAVRGEVLSVRIGFMPGLPSAITV